VFSKEENELLNDIVDDLCEGVIEKFDLKSEADAVEFLTNHVKARAIETLELIWNAVYPGDNPFPHERVSAVAEAEKAKHKPNESLMSRNK
jgi:hypothetical protein